MKKWIWSVLIGATLGFLLATPAQGLLAARKGLDLWLHTLVPTLLPFLILSGFLIHSGLVEQLSVLLSPILGRLFSISPSGCFAVLSGFLCGYPVGAKVVGDLSRNNRIHPEEARYLLGFVNNASPAFVLTFLLAEQLGDPSFRLPALLILYGTPVLYALLTKKTYLKRRAAHPYESKEKASQVQLNFGLLDACIYDAANTLLKIGGYVILFSVLAKMMENLRFLPSAIRLLLTGMLELTNGIPGIMDVFQGKTAFKLLIPLTAFGGFSALAQTASVLKGPNLSLRCYCFAKAVITLLAAAAVLFY